MTKKQSKKKTHAIRKIVILLIVLLILFIALCFVTPTESELITSSGAIADLELPAPVPGEQIIKHTGYTLSYNEEYEQPSYVAYELTAKEVDGGYDRADSFKADPAVKTGSATLADYKGSGYDRGHMAPAADFKWSEEAMSDTFYLSNMSPQVGAFNRGIWADLESAVRTMAYENGSVYVVTGPVLTDGPYETIGENKVAVPKRYYKVILDYTDPEIKAIGFVLPNASKTGELSDYVLTVNEVEEITGLDFFPALPDEVEEIIEGNVDLSLWSLKPYRAGDGEKTFIDSSSSSSTSELENVFFIIFYELKKEIFSALGITQYAKALGLI